MTSYSSVVCAHVAAGFSNQLLIGHNYPVLHSVILVLLFTCFSLAVDSISDVVCSDLQSVAPHVCCEPDTGNFCQIQCSNGLCRCVDLLTGMQIGDFTFLENDESVTCPLISKYIAVTIT